MVVALPETLMRAQGLARESVKQWKVNRESLLQAENLKKSVKTHADLIQISSKLARLRGQHDRSLSQAKYALVVLGRDCFQHSVVRKAKQGGSDQLEKLREFIQAEREEVHLSQMRHSQWFHSCSRVIENWSTMVAFQF